MNFIRKTTVQTALVFFLTSLPDPVWATQAHGAPEGLYVHQFSHLFFIFAMAILIYWLRSRGLVRQTGWRYLQYAAFFFSLWSIDAFFVHLLDEQFKLVVVTRTGPWHLRLDTPSGYGFLAPLYYLLKLDHLVCVPGLFFLYMGLRRLSHETEGPKAPEGGSR